MPDSTETPPTVAIVDAVAAKDDVDTSDLPPIADAIDPEALNTLLTSMDEPHRSDAHFQFEYHDYTVHITGDQEITLE